MTGLIIIAPSADCRYITASAKIEKFFSAMEDHVLELDNLQGKKIAVGGRS